MAGTAFPCRARTGARERMKSRVEAYATRQRSPKRERSKKNDFLRETGMVKTSCR
jgi:hypothetical protein